MVKNPTIVPARVIQAMEQMFIVDALLRKLPPNDSGMVQYDESTPLFADGDAEVVEEFGEIPTIGGRLGARKVAFTVKRALAILISQEMVNRNNVDRVNKQIKQVANTMIRTWETTFFNALLNHPDVPSYAAAFDWGLATGKVRFDLTEAGLLIENAAPADDLNNYYGFSPDTLVVGKRTRADLITSDDFNKVYRNSDLASKAPEYKGTLVNDYYGLRILVSRELDRLAPNKALLLESKTVGGISDERPTRSTPLYPDRPRETWRSDTVRQSAVVIDQPKAAVWITGVGT
jgi:hypothetical protein